MDAKLDLFDTKILEIFKSSPYEEPTAEIVVAGCDAIHPGHSVMGYSSGY